MMKLEGLSIEKICDKLTKEKIPTPSESKNMNVGWNNLHKGVWATRTVYDMLQNPTYIGNLTQCKLKKVSYKSKKVVRNKKNNWIVCEGAIDSIIDKDTFDMVQNLIRTTKNRVGDGLTDKLLLRGLIYCADCGHTIGFRAQSQNTKKKGLVTRIYGNCNYWARRKKQNVCTPHSVKYYELESLILDDIRETCKKYLDENNIANVLKNNNRIKKKKDSIKSEIFKLEQAINIANKKIDISYNDKLEGNITLEMYKRTYNNLTMEINDSKTKKLEFEKMLFDLENNQEINDTIYLDKIKKFLEIKNPSKALISSLIDRIEIDEEKNIDIYYKFKLL